MRAPRPSSCPPRGDDGLSPWGAEVKLAGTDPAVEGEGRQGPALLSAEGKLRPGSAAAPGCRTPGRDSGAVTDALPPFGASVPWCRPGADSGTYGAAAALLGARSAESEAEPPRQGHDGPARKAAARRSSHSLHRAQCRTVVRKRREESWSGMDRVVSPVSQESKEQYLYFLASFFGILWCMRGIHSATELYGIPSLFLCLYCVAFLFLKKLPHL